MTTSDPSASRASKAMELVTDFAKQLITLGTALLGVTMTFLKDLAGQAANGGGLLIAGWIALLLSIMAGVAVMMSVVGHLSKSESPDPYARNIRLIGGSQIVLFVIGVALVGLAVVVAA